MAHEPLTADSACRALGEAGFDLAPAIEVEACEDRWAMSTPEKRMAWFPANAKGRERLDFERKILRLLAERCSPLAIAKLWFARLPGARCRGGVK